MWNTVGTQSHYLKREDDTCIATALNSPLTRDEWLTTHRLMPVEKVAAGVATLTATANSTSTAQCRHSCWKHCAGSIRIGAAPKRTSGNARKLTEMNCRCRSCAAETMRIRYLASRSVLGGQRQWWIQRGGLRGFRPAGVATPPPPLIFKKSGCDGFSCHIMLTRLPPRRPFSALPA